MPATSILGAPGGRLLSLEDLSAFQMGPRTYDQCQMNVRRTRGILNNDEGVGRWKHVKAFYRAVFFFTCIGEDENI